MSPLLSTFEVNVEGVIVQVVVTLLAVLDTVCTPTVRNVITVLVAAAPDGSNTFPVTVTLGGGAACAAAADRTSHPTRPAVNHKRKLDLHITKARDNNKISRRHIRSSNADDLNLTCADRVDIQRVRRGNVYGSDLYCQDFR
ncbi:hypothetical protein UFOVP1287_58 [uncultured Caudovirales phage]|uniref:Uncharacterized protein n=1 Tax=uncultured Caudovirales phage TaxID=2100421 RepID=A0A6J5S8P9_9CAUD|nr:hypothetical protein UFOVP1287_58 [uncultured Caudovirales phage]CAB4205277.1 hypothetical protein UFOVP1408_55 [uncultured Caudovirales phage]